MSDIINPIGSLPQINPAIMQRVYSYLRKAIQEFDMIGDGDVIAVGISGGKDSIMLLYGLAGLRRFYPKHFDIKAITIDPQFNDIPGDYSPVEQVCESLGIPYIVKRTDIANVVFDVRKEKHPCSLCAKMRRGALHEATVSAGCNKLALGHNFDDVVETFLMNLFIEGRLGCFQPKNHLSKRDIFLIRPLVMAPEKKIRQYVERCNLPVIKSACPADGYTRRAEMKEFIEQQEKLHKGFSLRVFGALRRSGINGWGFNTPQNDDGEEDSDDSYNGNNVLIDI